MSFLNLASGVPGAHALASGGLGLASDVSAGLGANGQAANIQRVANNIANPNVNIYGNANPYNSSPHADALAWAAQLARQNGNTNTANTGGSGGSGGSGGGSGGSSGPSAQDLSAYNIYTGQANDALTRAQNSWNTQQKLIGNNYNQQNNALRSGLNRNTDNYNQSVLGQNQDSLRNENQINQGAQTQYQSLMHVLGGMGAGGGSEAQYLVPQAVNQQAQLQLAGNDRANATTLRNLSTGYNDYLGKEKDQQNQLNDWKTDQIAQGQADYNSNRQNLLGILQGLHQQVTNPDTLKSQLDNAVGNIRSYVNPATSYTGTTPVYTPGSVASFETQAAPTAQVTGQNAGASPTPYLDLLLGNQKKQTNAVA